MPNLLSVRFSKVGYVDARLDGLAYSVAQDGEPKNSLIIGANSGGKTSQLHLIFSLFLPHRNDLISQKDNSARDFAYYFEPNEISFVATEWNIPNSQIDLNGNQKTRVIGRFTQFTNREEYKHETYFFSFIADQDLGIDDLPITSSIPLRVKEHCRTISDAKKYLRENFDKPGREFYGPSEKMEQWQAHLRSIGFNIDMYRLMMLFTMSEGDPASFLKKFCNQEAVLGFVTKEVMDKNSTSTLRDMLVQYRDSIKLAPTTRLQIASYNNLLDMFRQMEPIAEDLSQATKLHLDILGDLAIVATRIMATISKEKEKQSFLLETQAAEKTILLLEKKELADAEGELRGVKERLAEIVCLAAKEDHVACKKRLEEASSLVKAMRAVVDRVALFAAEKEGDDLSRRLDALNEPVRSLADELAMAEHLFAQYLEEDRVLTSATTALLEGAEKKATNFRKKLESERESQKSNLSAEEKERDLLELAENERKQSLESMVNAGFLQAGALPDATLTALEKEFADIEIILKSLQTESESVKINLATLEQQINENAAKNVRLKEEHVKSLNAHTTYSQHYEKVAELQAIRDIFELADPDLFLPGLKEKLQNKISDTDNDIKTLEQETSSLQERIEVIENNDGLLPAAADVESVIKALRTANINAYSWWQVFSKQNRSVEESVAETRKDPLRIGGVAVSGKHNLLNAQEVLSAGCNVLSPVFVSDYSVEVKEHEHNGFVVLPDVALATDKLHAEQFCIMARNDIHNKEEKIEVLFASRLALKKAEEALLGFLGAYDEASLAIIDNHISRVNGELLTCTQEQQILNDQEIDARKQLDRIETAVRGYDEKLSMGKKQIGTLRDHVLRHEEKRAERGLRILVISSAIKTLMEAIEVKGEDITDAEREESKVRTKAGEARGAISSIQDEINKLNRTRRLPTDSFKLLATTTHSARALHSEKKKALESANSNEEYILVNTRCSIANENYAKLLNKWNSEHSDTPIADIEKAEVLVAGRKPSEVDCEKISKEKDEASQAVGVSKEKLKTSEEGLKELKEENKKFIVTHCGLSKVDCTDKEEALKWTIDKFSRSIDEHINAIAVRSEEIQKAKTEIDLLVSLTNQFDPEIAASTLAQGTPYSEYADANTALQVAKKAESDTAAKVVSITEVLRGFNSNLLALLDNEICLSIATIVSHIKEEIHRCNGFLKDDLGEFSIRIHNALEPLEYELFQYEKNEQEVIDQVMLDVGKAFRLLSNLEKRSKIPALGGIWHQWTGKPFIRFKTQVKPDSEQARQAVAEAITMMAQINEDLPAGDVIILSALVAVLGNAYKIYTLKPDTSPTTEYSGITDPTGLYSWSGGQKLSGAVLLYMALCNLLSLEGQTGSVLLMDNPFGTCNNIEFVRLIVALTHQYGVQLVAFTPTEDKQIRRLFPLNVMTRKGGTDGIIKSTGRPVVKYDETIYNDGELTLLEITREIPVYAAT